MSRIIGAYRMILLVALCLAIPLSFGLVEVYGKLLGGFRDSRRINLGVSSFLMRWFLRLCGIEVYSDLKHDVDSTKNILLLSNHISYLDVISLQSLLPLAFLAKSEIRDWPVFGYLARRISTIFVDRESMPSRIQCINKISESLDHCSVALFPEGTTSRGDTPLKDSWKAGHLLAYHPSKTTLILTGVYYENHSDMAWIDDMDLLPHIWSCLKRPRIRIFISTQEYYPSQQELGNLRQLSKTLCQKVSELCLASKQQMLRQNPLASVNFVRSNTHDPKNCLD